MYDIFLFLSAFSPVIALVICRWLLRYYDRRDSYNMFCGFMGIPKNERKKVRFFDVFKK